MKKRIQKTAVLLLALITFSIMFAGCGDEMDEPDITPEYLEGNFATQLENDGAEVIVGSVDIFEEDGTFKARITEKQVVASSSKKGYYLAETNNLYERSIGSDCRIVYVDSGAEVVGSPEEFMDNHNGESDKIYKTYCFSDSCELILPVKPEDELK